ncbi:hypothetical protein [Streptomyces phaeochromogenes]
MRHIQADATDRSLAASRPTRPSEGGGALSLTVAPGQTVTTTAGGQDQVARKVTCKVAKVTRIAG